MLISLPQRFPRASANSFSSACVNFESKTECSECEFLATAVRPGRWYTETDSICGCK